MKLILIQAYWQILLNEIEDKLLYETLSLSFKIYSVFSKKVFTDLSVANNTNQMLKMIT